MDTIRYYLIPLVTACGALGFYYGGDWVWLGAATFPALMVLDVILPRDYSERKVNAFFADLTQYLQLPLMITMYGFLFRRSKRVWLNLMNLCNFWGVFYLWPGLVECPRFRFRMIDAPATLAAAKNGTIVSNILC